MIHKNLYVEPHEFLMEPTKSNGICLVFEEGMVPDELLIESVINWAKSARTLGFSEDPYEVEYDEEDFGDGTNVSIKWTQEVPAVSYEVINLVAGYLDAKFPDSGCKEIQVCIAVGSELITH